MNKKYLLFNRLIFAEEKGRGLASTKDSLDAPIRGLEDYIKKSFIG